jgi:ABC-2 type transport system ATP-binding protein
MPYVIETEQLCKRYGQRMAVDHVSMHVGAGEVFGFLGPNGAGKTTTIGMLLGLIKPSAGRALVFGHDMQQNPQAALAHVGAMIEAPAFYPYLSAYENLLVLARAGNIAKQRIAIVLEHVELNERAHDHVKAFSQGMRQRLAIAAALLADPQLIMLDEPTNGLDPAGQHDIRSLIRRLASGGRTILLCSHQLHEIEQLCERVAILKAGKLLAQGRVDDLLKRDGIFVRVRGDLHAALALVRGLDWVVGARPHANGILVDAASERSADITIVLTNAGIPVSEIRQQQATLEDVFLELTEGST